jgi:hypothetical protein
MSTAFPGLIDNSEDGGPAGLLDLRDLAFDGNGFPDFSGQIGYPHRCGFPLHVLHLVYLDGYLFKVDVAIRADLADPDKDGIPLLVVAFHIALVYKALDPVVQLDEHAEIGKALNFALVGIPFGNIGKITSRSQPVDQDIIYVIILHLLTPHTSVRAYCCDLVLVSSTLRAIGTALYDHEWAPEGKIYLLYIPFLPGRVSP